MLSPPIAAAQHTTPPIRIAATGPAGLSMPRPRRRSDEIRIVEIVMPETGLFEDPTRPAMYDDRWPRFLRITRWKIFASRHRRCVRVYG